MTVRRKLLIAVGIGLALTILIPVIHHYKLRFALDNYLAQLKAKGEPLELAQVVPPPLTPERNSAPLFWQAVSLRHTNLNILETNPPPAMHQVAPGKAMIGWLQPEIRDENIINSWQDVRDGLAQDEGALKLLSQLTNNSAFDFHLQYDGRYAMLATNLPTEKRAVQLLTASAIYNLHNGDTAAAVSNVQTALVLVTGTDDERTAISQLVRMAMAAIASAATWEILQATNITDEELTRLQAAWAQPEFIRAWNRSLPVEREGDVTMVEQWRKFDAELGRYLGLEKNARDVLGMPDDSDSFPDKVKLRARIFLWRYWWSYADELLYLKGFEVLTSTAHAVETNGAFLPALNRQKAGLDQLGISRLTNSSSFLFYGPEIFDWIQAKSIVTLGRVAQRVMRAEAERQIVMTAIALKRYQLAHGNYPAKLDSLVPEFLAKTPPDPVDGQPLRYRLQPDGNYLLYSIGENGIDDGGNPAIKEEGHFSGFFWESPQALDWIWPQPATPEEIQKYYAGLSKGAGN